nr:lysozyme inhibitor LprI family protein [uncultured Sphingomonas sp.]
MGNTAKPWLGAILLLGSSCLLSGCGKPQIECGSPDAQAVVVDVLKEQVRRSAAKAGEDEESGTKLSLSKIRAAVEQLRITLDAVRTTRDDPNSSKRFCAAKLELTMPVATLDDADRARTALDLQGVAAAADTLGIENGANRFEVSIEYEVQPTDTGDRIFAEVEGLESFSQFVGEVVAFALSRTRLEDGQRNLEAEQSQQRSAEEQALAEGQQLTLESAQAESKLANQAINVLWQQLPATSRSQLLSAQRTWGRKKDADCKLEGARTSTVSAEMEAARLSCDARYTRERYTYLEQYRGSETEPSSRVPEAPAETESEPADDL